MGATAPLAESQPPVAPKWNYTLYRARGLGKPPFWVPVSPSPCSPLNPGPQVATARHCPNYAFFHAFFFMVCHVLSKICHNDQKHTLFSPLNDVRAYIAWSWKMNPIIRPKRFFFFFFFFTRMIPNFKYKCPRAFHPRYTTSGGRYSAWCKGELLKNYRLSSIVSSGHLNHNESLRTGGGAWNGIRGRAAHKTHFKHSLSSSLRPPFQHVSLSHSEIEHKSTQAKCTQLWPLKNRWPIISMPFLNSVNNLQ